MRIKILSMNRPFVDSLNVEIECERLCLHPIGEHHGKLLFSFLSDPELYVWIASNPPESIAELEERWASTSQSLYLEGEFSIFKWAIQRKQDEVWIGVIDAEIGPNDIATNVGYIIFKPFWGCGYATEALRNLGRALSDLGIKEQGATVTLGNSVSEKVLERAGFIRNRILPDNDIVQGVSVDDIEYIYRS